LDQEYHRNDVVSSSVLPIEGEGCIMFIFPVKVTFVGEKNVTIYTKVLDELWCTHKFTIRMAGYYDAVLC